MFSIIIVVLELVLLNKLQELLDEYEDFESLDKVDKSSYVLYSYIGSELWESKFDGLLSLVKVFTSGEEW